MHTKIIATIGPACNERFMIKRLVEQGVRIFRLNFSHGSAGDFEHIVRNLRSVENELQHGITIMQDLSGPKIRAGELKESPLSINVGDELFMGPSDQMDRHDPYLPFDHREIIKDLKVGDEVRVSDGGLSFEILEKSGQVLKLRSENSGIITSRKGINFPGLKASIAALTTKDREDLAAGLDMGIDAVAMSFVQCPEDVSSAKHVIEKKGRWIPVIAKLERQVAVNRLEEILRIADGIMVARGDLGLECPLSSLPTLQKRIIAACNQAAKPVIVATQMLLSMVSNPMPTRAETTDVANAVLDGTDCLMLSEETAIVEYPVQAVGYMREIAEEAEKFFFELGTSPLEPKKQVSENFIGYNACLLADKIGSKALVAHTDSGATVRLISSCRPRQTIFGLSPRWDTQKFMNFSWGVVPVHISEEPQDHLQRTEKFVENFSGFLSGEDLVITSGHPKPGVESSPTNLLKIYRK